MGVIGDGWICERRAIWRIGEWRWEGRGWRVGSGFEGDFGGMD